MWLVSVEGRPQSCIQPFDSADTSVDRSDRAVIYSYLQRAFGARGASSRGFSSSPASRVLSFVVVRYYVP